MIHQAASARRLRRNFSTFESSCDLPTSLPQLKSSILTQHLDNSKHIIVLMYSLYTMSNNIREGQRVKQPRDGNWSGRPAPVGLPIGSRFFDRPVKLVEKPVKFSFLATKRHLSTNRNILEYFIINKTFYKKSVLTNHIFRKHLLNGFKL